MWGASPSTPPTLSRAMASRRAVEAALSAASSAFSSWCSQTLKPSHGLEADTSSVKAPREEEAVLRSQWYCIPVLLSPCSTQATNTASMTTILMMQYSNPGGFRVNPDRQSANQPREPKMGKRADLE